MLALASCLRPLEHIVRIKTRTDAADPTKKTSRRLVGGIEHTCDGRGALLACRGGGSRPGKESAGKLSEGFELNTQTTSSIEANQLNSCKESRKLSKMRTIDHGLRKSSVLESLPLRAPTS